MVDEPLALNLKSILVTRYQKLSFAWVGWTMVKLHGFFFFPMRFSQTVQSIFFSLKLSHVFERKSLTSILYVLNEEKVSNTLNLPEPSGPFQDHNILENGLFSN